MSKLLFNSAGQAIPLGAVLGQGGEGAVYDTPTAGKDTVAKVYHYPVTPMKRSKLAAMVSAGDNYLRMISAWPSQLLGDRAGATLGFLMPKVAGHEPIHHVYSPAHRKKFFPKLTFIQLVAIARNTAAAFDAIHAHGHVIGDVNQGNVAVAANCTVKLIDCDSFQITVSGVTHLCEVGVPHFTPPELQQIKSFHQVTRTANHDNFGLAVLLFHLLFMGRHPFSGRFLGKGDMSLEKAIAEFRFAYASDNQSRQMAIPPAIPSLDLVPPSMARMFELAFNEQGARSKRPTASEWVSHLEALTKNLTQCKVSPSHQYSSHLTMCPWCQIENTARVQYFVSNVLQAVFSTVEQSSSWQQVWQAVSGIQLPVFTTYSAPNISVMGAPPPPETKRESIRYHVVIGLAIATVFALSISAPGMWLIWLLVGLITVALNPTPSAAEHAKRKTARDTAQTNYASALGNYDALRRPLSFEKKRVALEKIRSELSLLGPRFDTEKAKLAADVATRQKERFLDNFFISSAGISGIGTTRVATLASYGVETALDIDAQKIHRIPGFGDVLTGQLLAWRRRIESRFVFDASKTVDPRDVQLLTNKFNGERTRLETELRIGLAELQRLYSEVVHARQDAKQKTDIASHILAKATADFAAMKS